MLKYQSLKIRTIVMMHSQNVNGSRIDIVVNLDLSLCLIWKNHPAADRFREMAGIYMLFFSVRASD